VLDEIKERTQDKQQLMGGKEGNQYHQQRSSWESRGGRGIIKKKTATYGGGRVTIAKGREKKGGKVTQKWATLHDKTSGGAFSYLATRKKKEGFLKVAEI